MKNKFVNSFQTTNKIIDKMKEEKTIEVLNTLITINNDRIEGYETAAKETDEQD